jgi:hypothetical protein
LNARKVRNNFRRHFGANGGSCHARGNCRTAGGRDDQDLEAAEFALYAVERMRDRPAADAVRMVYMAEPDRDIERGKFVGGLNGRVFGFLQVRQQYTAG